VLRQCGVIRAYSLNDMLEFARGLRFLPTPKGENVVIVTGAGARCVAFRCLCDTPPPHEHAPDLDAAFKKFIPPFGASGNPVDITGVNHQRLTQYIKLALDDERIHAPFSATGTLLLRHPWCLPPLSEVVEEPGNRYPQAVVASLVGDVEGEEACAISMIISSCLPVHD